jgi:putative ABC transport system substrate-binding protein
LPPKRCRPTRSPESGSWAPTLEFRFAEGNERLHSFAAELVSLKVDVIVPISTPAALAAQRATRTIPIVFIAVGEPVAQGLVASLARPGGNVTGLSFVFRELIGKCLELLKQAVPGVSRVGVLRQASSSPERARPDSLKASEAAARALGVRLQIAEVREPVDIERAFAEMVGARAGAVAVWGGSLLMFERYRVTSLAMKNRLPTVFTFREYVEAGGLMSYGPDIADLSRHAATYVDRILKGAKPGDLPVEQPTKFELLLNLKTAKALALTMPPPLLQRADQVME